MAVPNVLEVMHLRLIKEHSYIKRVNRGIAPPLHDNALSLIQIVELSLILLGPQEVEGTNLKV